MHMHETIPLTLGFKKDSYLPGAPLKQSPISDLQGSWVLQGALSSRIGNLHPFRLP